MIKLKKIIELKSTNKSDRFVSKALNISKERVNFYSRFFRDLGITVNDIKNISDAELFKLVDNKRSRKLDVFDQMKSRFPEFKKRMSQKGMTLRLLWKEFKEQENMRGSEGYSYSRFCYLYNEWLGQTYCYIPQHYKAGENLFIDYAGDKLKIYEGIGGTEKEVDVFVSILGASQLIYAEAAYDQKTDNFIRSLENAFHYYDGVPELVVCDNMKTAVIKADRYEPDLNENFERLITHYGSAGYSARIRHPKDKAHVENAVKIVYQSIYGRIQNELFYSIESLNNRIKELLKELNNRKLTGCEYSRQELFNETDGKALKKLPKNKFEIKKFQTAKVRKNCHVYLSEDKRYYSVPHLYCRKNVKIIYDSKVVEIFCDLSRIAYHKREYKSFKYTTIHDHMPKEKEFRIELDKLMSWAESIGTETYEYVNKVIEKANHPLMAQRSCYGILSLSKKNKYGRKRLNNACQKAASYKYYGYKVILNILEKNLDTIETLKQLEMNLPVHENIRSNFI